MLSQEGGRQSLQDSMEQIGLKIEEFVIGKTSRLVGQKIANIESNSHGGYLIIAIHRQGGSTLAKPPPDTVVRIGDTIVVLGLPRRMESLAFKASPSAVTSRGHEH